jgi:hypothetical protein
LSLLLTKTKATKNQHRCTQDTKGGKTERNPSLMNRKMMWIQRRKGERNKNKVHHPNHQLKKGFTSKE